MNNNLHIAIDILGANQLLDYFPQDSFFAFHSCHFGTLIDGKRSKIRAGKDFSGIEKKEIIKSVELFVLQICFVNQSNIMQELILPRGPFRAEYAELKVFDLSGNQIQKREIFWGEEKTKNPARYQIEANKELCFDLVGEIYLNKLIFPIYEYELQHGNEYYFQLQFQGILSNKVKWLFK